MRSLASCSISSSGTAGRGIVLGRPIKAVIILSKFPVRLSLDHRSPDVRGWFSKPRPQCWGFLFGTLWITQAVAFKVPQSKPQFQHLGSTSDAAAPIRTRPSWGCSPQPRSRDGRVSCPSAENKGPAESPIGHLPLIAIIPADAGHRDQVPLPELRDRLQSRSRRSALHSQHAIDVSQLRRSASQSRRQVRA
jgi:hypothetical protein